MRRFIFIFLLITECVLIFLSNYLLLSDALYYNNFAEQLTYEQIEALINQSKKWEWVSYAIIPVVILLKLTLVASCLSTGLYFFTNQFRFKQAFGVALEAEFVFLIPALLKILWFVFVQTGYTLQDLQFFYPLSALNLFNHSTLEPWLVYPLQLVNLFELVYWFLLARGVSKIIDRDFTKSFEVVLASYGVGLLLWVAVVMFISVSYST